MLTKNTCLNLNNQENKKKFSTVFAFIFEIKN